MKTALIILLATSIAIAEETKQPSEVTRTYNTNLAKAEQEYKDKLVRLKTEYIKDMEKCLDNAMRSRNLAEANRINAQIGVTRTELVKLRGKVTGPQKSYKALIMATGDDTYIMCVNGKPLWAGGAFSKQNEQRPLDGRIPEYGVVTLKTGDVITVKAVNRNYQYGFACAILLQGGKSILSNTTDWRAYTPADPIEWYKPEGITEERTPKDGEPYYTQPTLERIVAGDYKTIWDGKDTCYLTLTVTEDVIRDNKLICSPNITKSLDN